jgi:hypothetical protein
METGDDPKSDGERFRGFFQPLSPGSALVRIVSSGPRSQDASHWWLPRCRSLAEASIASLGLTVRHASGCCRTDRSSQEPPNPTGRRLSIGLISAVEHARRSWVLASFSLRSGAHVLKYAPLRSSRKPRQNPGLASGQLKDETNGQREAGRRGDLADLPSSHPPRFHRKGRSSEGLMARRAIRRATQHQTAGGSAKPQLSPSVLLIFL